MILKSELNARNKITEIGALAVPVLKYSFGIINWRIIVSLCSGWQYVHARIKFLY